MTPPTTSAPPYPFVRERGSIASLAILALFTACAGGSGPAASSETLSSGSTWAPSTSDSSGATSGSSSSSGANGSAVGTSSSTTGSSDATTEPFEDPTAFDTDVAIECNTLDQDCPEGERCTPYANDGGGEWNAVRCVPIDGFTSTLGESCEIEGDIRSGFDNCGPATLCMDVDLDPKAIVLECVAMCVATPDDFDVPTCADSKMTCVIAGTLAVCLPSGNKG